MAGQPLFFLFFFPISLSGTRLALQMNGQTLLLGIPFLWKERIGT